MGLSKRQVQGFRNAETGVSLASQNKKGSYTLCNCLSGKWGSNPRPSAWEADALPTELLPHCKAANLKRFVVDSTSLSFFVSLSSANAGWKYFISLSFNQILYLKSLPHTKL